MSIDIKDYGLPSEGEVAQWVSQYFPEFNPGECEAGIHNLVEKGDPGVFYTAAGKAEKALSTGYSPVVVSQEQADETREIHGNQPVNTKNDQNSQYKQQHNDSIIVGTKSLTEIRSDFPILSEKVNGYPLVWLDNGATTQRPRAVIDRLTYYYEHENSNVHRGAHALAARSTDAYEAARQTVANFIGAPNKDNIVFVRGTTEAINLVAQAYVKPKLQPGDEIIVTLLEHHANIVPWQLVAQETGAVIKVAPVDESGQIIISEYEKLFTKHTKFVSATHVSNVLGTITPVAELIAIAHRHGVRILIDGAQSIAHIPVNVSALDADFFVFSGHKIFAPTGIGAVYGKKEVLEEARPYHGGGNMIKDVTFERTIYNPAPNKFEAGTGSIADAVGLGAALDYLNSIGMPAVNKHEHELLLYAMKEMRKIPGLHLIGTAAQKASVLSFKLDGHADDQVGAHLNNYGIAVRTGHHCAQPILRSFGLESTIRPTLALYNSPEDIDALVKALRILA
ncbi:MAG: SufS family cysteine desulfurase [Suilimivivens sp.]